jgi:UDP-N-acetylglucosamine/UDP-N-acetylgalactosamine diphosphorylase
VGPCQLGFNTVIAAGVIYREDCPQGHKLLIGKESQKDDMDFYPGLYWSVKRRVLNSIEYIANIIALRQWYLLIRSKFYDGSDLDKFLYEGAIEKLEIVFNERVKRFKALANKMEKSIQLYKSVMGNQMSEKLLNQKIELLKSIQVIEDEFISCKAYLGEESLKIEFLKSIDMSIQKKGKNYINVIQNLSETETKVGTSWLLTIIDHVRKSVLEYLPSYI